jgi:hypothetical protein
MYFNILLHLGSGYFLIDPINTIHCCGQITMWHYKPVKTGTIAFGIWRKTHVNNIYKLVGINTVVAKGKVNITIYPAITTSAVE